MECFALNFDFKGTNMLNGNYNLGYTPKGETYRVII